MYEICGEKTNFSPLILHIFAFFLDPGKARPKRPNPNSGPEGTDPSETVAQTEQSLVTLDQTEQNLAALEQASCQLVSLRRLICTSLEAIETCRYP